MRAEMLDLAQVALGVDVGGPHPNVRHRDRGVVAVTELTTSNLLSMAPVICHIKKDR